MFLCQPCPCLPSQLPIHRSSGPADLGSAQVQLKFSPAAHREKEKISHNRTHLLIEPLCLICPLAPEKLEALISLDTGVWGFLFALAAFLTYQSPPLPALCFLCPAAPTVQLSPKTVTVAAVNGINTCIKTTCCHPLWLSPSLAFSCVGLSVWLLELTFSCDDLNIGTTSRWCRDYFFSWITTACLLGSLAHCSAFPAPSRFPICSCSLCEFRCVMTWLLPLISDMWRGIYRSGVERLYWLEMLVSVCRTPLQICYSKHLFLRKLELSFHVLLVMLKPQLQLLLFPGAHLTHFTCEASENCPRSLFNHCLRIIQRVSASVCVSVCRTLPFSLCVVQHCISPGYPPQGSNNTTSWWKLGEFFVVMTLLPARFAQ